MVGDARYGLLSRVLPHDAHRPELRLTKESLTHTDEGDIKLAARAGQGDPDAQRALARQLIGTVRRTVRALLRGRPESDDALQLSMMEVLRSATTYRGEASLERWAGRIAARTALRLVRQLRARGELTFPEGDEALPEAAGVGPTEMRDDAHTSSIHAHLARLPDARRTCIILRHVHGYTVEEIAELTRVSPNTVKDRLLQGRAQLRKALRREDADEVPAAIARKPRARP
jgi:RNA polymerase sigma-70 factor, ECF subfamily